MLIIRHRVNSINELRSVDSSLGIEIDVRDQNKRLILSHDPFSDGELLEDFLSHYRHKFLIFNVKCEGVEQEIINLAREFGIEDYFLLDVSFPFMIKLSKLGFKKIAVRFSEFESIETCCKLAGKFEWVWVDCFTKMPLDESSYRILSKNFKICIVSPELVGRPQDIDMYIAQLKTFKIDAVCTKIPQKWGSANNG